MTSSIRDALLKSINTRARRIKKIKENTSVNMTPQEIVINFLDSTISLYTVNDKVDFQNKLNIESRVLGAKLAAFDPMASIELLWDDAPIDSMSEWRRLRLNGVKITWSKLYAEKNDLPLEQTISIFDILLNKK